MGRKAPKGKRYLPMALTAIAGGVIGYAYYRFVGCAAGTCAITSNPIISTLYGAVLGLLIGVVLTPGSCGGDGRRLKDGQEH